MWKSVLAVWGSCAVAISVALYYTQDMRCLWFLIVPMLMNFSTARKKGESDDNN